ncbi:DUF2244 domain-containing protein [Microbulbifer thermotolerans]|uniref:DUF2244 domain-containing protein n=1 Tax=Microbulbifer thermotolerans TaxID=252514 RepID=A0A143HLB3_MICTH|nr:DUF2244 domain-containing protein [Microbulbifer thermotolerans]AMX02504.1 hypothetical protein A3224_07825 [Microbulbifer thermotolerans]MCX2779360.1 DUF2244 domain-containing protein [Microbulbifer thermotolerans]MCX2782436.1 DUF2244 domain-containing protein [Microbulbifer thermotolerans]MCX2795021.1 DUF2244 domain-containing protein [Microbulbifer thermotolerans]MCX2800589.1 DUF2244 domain-containing protein [Microbulbifer thermotolerans]
MVTQVGSSSAGSACILLAPNQSISRSGSLWVFTSLLALSLGISLAFALAGAWMILPFASLEMLLLFVLFGFVYVEGSRRQVIRISGERVILDWCRGPRQQSVYHREFQRSSLAVLVRLGDGVNEPASLCFSGPEGCLQVGDFLTDAERADLVQKLSQCGIYARKERGYRLRQF